MLITLGMNLARSRNFGSQTSHYPRVLRSWASTLVVLLYLKPSAWSLQGQGVISDFTGHKSCMSTVSPVVSR